MVLMLIILGGLGNGATGITSQIVTDKQCQAVKAAISNKSQSGSNTYADYYVRCQPLEGTPK